MQALQNIRVVLVSPVYGGNVGSVCRAMMNMGVSNLAIAAPRDDFNEFDAGKWAYSAKSIWENRKVFPSLQEAVADCHVVAGTTAREGLYRRHVKSPREWAATFLEAAHHGPVALVFGTETSGLSNEDLACCTHLIRIPSAPAYESLNLSHAVMVCLYEIYVLSGDFQPRQEGSPPVTMALRERMFSMWQKALLDIGFMEEEKADHMMMALRRIFSRGCATEIDANILMGMARQTMWHAQHGKSPAPEPNPTDANTET